MFDGEDVQIFAAADATNAPVPGAQPADAPLTAQALDVADAGEGEALNLVWRARGGSSRRMSRTAGGSQMTLTSRVVG
jgi:hypothetical protein